MAVAFVIGNGAKDDTNDTTMFVNADAQDYHLTGSTTAGTALGSPYNMDMDGCMRATPDRGAFEFPACAGGDTTPPAAPQNPYIVTPFPPRNLRLVNH